MKYIIECSCGHKKEFGDVMNAFHAAQAHEFLNGDDHRITPKAVKEELNAPKPHE